MNKLFLLAGLFLLSVGEFYAQENTSPIKIESGKLNKDSGSSTAASIFHLENGNTLVLNPFRDKLFLKFSLYDSEMNLIKSTSLYREDYFKESLNGRKIKTEFFKKIKGKYFLLYSMMDEMDIRLFALEFNPETLSFEDNARSLMKKTLEQETKSFLVTLSESNDRSKFLISLYEVDQNRFETVHHYIMNDVFRIIKKAKFVNNDEDEGYSYTGSILSNDGKIISAAYLIDAELGLSAFSTSYVPLNVFIFENESSKPKIQEVNIDNKQFTGIVLGYDNEGGQIVIGGLYREVNRVGKSGVFLFKIDANTYRMKTESLSPFSEELLSKVYKELLDKSKDFVGLRYQKILNLMEDEHGNYYFVLDSRIGVVTHGLTVIKLDNIGSFQWDKYIPRKLYGYYSSSTTFNQTTHTIFDANFYIKTFTKEDQFCFLMNKAKNAFLMFTLTEDGSASFDRITVAKDFGFALLNTYAFKDGYIYFISGFRKRKTRLNRIKIYGE